MTFATMTYEKDPLSSSGDIDVLLNDIDFDDVIDPFAFLDALANEGEHWIVTCGCGTAECAGIWKPVTVTHQLEKDTITWQFDTKFYRYKGSLPIDENGIATLTLDRKHALESVKLAINAMRNDTTCDSVYGLPFEDSKTRFYEHPLVEALLQAA
jgi:hypothetical protein